MNKWLDILISRKLWVALIGLVLVVVKAFNPEFPVTEEQIVGLVMLVVSYIVGTAIDPGAPVQSVLKKLLALVQSKKFWASLAGIVFIFVSDKFPVSMEMAVELVTYLISALVVGFGISDRIKYLSK